MATKLIFGCGYLGRRVAALWREEGHRVVAATRKAPPFFADLGIEPLTCDVLLPTTLKDLPAADTVLYAIGWDRTSGAGMRAVYVEGLTNVLAHLPKPGRFLYVSSTSVYGQTDESWVDEAAATEPQEESGQIVLEAEKRLREVVPDAVVLRFAGIYGPGRLLRQKAIAAGEAIVAAADKWLNLIHVDDGARVILAAEERARAGGTYIVSDGVPVRRRDFFDELARLLGAPPPRFVAPPPEQAAPPHERANRRLRNDRMLRELGVQLRHPSYREGLHATLRLL